MDIFRKQASEYDTTETFLKNIIVAIIVDGISCTLSMGSFVYQCDSKFIHLDRFKELSRTPAEHFDIVTLGGHLNLELT